MLGKLRQSEDGSTLIFVLVIMLIAMLITATVSFVILKSVQSSTGYSEAARAHYAAESLAERSLYYIQAQRLAKTAGVSATVDTVKTLTETLNNSATASVTATVSDSALTKDLAQYQTQQYDIFGEEYTAGYQLAPLAGLSSLQVNWSEPATCPVAEQMEIAFSSWTQFAWQDISDPSIVRTRYIVPCHSDGSIGSSCHYPFGVDDTHLYKVFVKPLDCAVNDVQVQALDSTLAVIDTKNQINVVSTGSYGHSAKTVSVTTTWNAPLNEYFNFVLFSEDTLTK